MSTAGLGRKSVASFIPWLFVLFFAVIFAVNLTMVWFAVGSFPGLVTQRAYDDGLAYNRNIAAAAQQAQLGWEADVEARAGPERMTALTVHLRNAAGSALSGAIVSARLERLAETSDDMSLVLDDRGAGVYVGHLALPDDGVWNVHVVATHGADLFVVDRQVTLP